MRPLGIRFLLALVGAGRTIEITAGRKRYSAQQIVRKLRRADDLAAGPVCPGRGSRWKDSEPIGQARRGHAQGRFERVGTVRAQGGWAAPFHVPAAASRAEPGRYGCRFAGLAAVLCHETPRAPVPRRAWAALRFDEGSARNLAGACGGVYRRIHLDLDLGTLSDAELPTAASPWPPK